MKVFLSWSGARSKAVAELLDDWIQCVLQAVKPWMSARDIDRGSLWFTEINDQLKEVSTGIVCLTKENKDRPWILFEAGALARGLSSQRVMTFLIDLSPTDIGDPLAQFNHTMPSEEGLRSLVTSINGRLGDLAISPRTLENVFETYWPQFRARFDKIIEEIPEQAVIPPRTEESKVDEILSHVRGMDKRLRDVERGGQIPIQPWKFGASSATEESRLLLEKGRAIVDFAQKGFAAGRSREWIIDYLAEREGLTRLDLLPFVDAAHKHHLAKFDDSNAAF